MIRIIIIEDNRELAVLIASAAMARGYDVTIAGTGAEALAAVSTEHFDCAVVDLLLPDVRGSELLAELRGNKVPSVVISGVFKGDRFARACLETYGAKAYFEKPFKMADLLDAVASAANRTGPSSSTAAPVESADLPLFGQTNRVSTSPPAPTATTAKRTGAATWALSGDLGTTSVPRLLTAYYEARHSGRLVLRQNALTKVVYFAEGKPVYAASNLVQERFGKFCVRQGLIPEEKLEAVMNLVRDQRLKTGEAMVQLGLLSPEQRLTALERQVKEILWSTFSWTEGKYTFSARAPANDEMLRLAVFPGTLVLDGVFEVETLLTLRRKMALDRKLFPVADPPYGLHQFSLSGPQATLLAYADGTKTVGDLLAVSELTEREALASLLAFELLGLIEERSREDTSRRISFGI
jgi:DNA-binding response OmpR family regulator